MTNVTAALVFDSWLDSAPECRSAKPDERHLIYQGSGLLIDLLLKQSGEDGRIRVGGQILTADSATGIVAGITVYAKREGECFTAKTNALGEFTFQSVPESLFEFCIMLPDRHVCVRCLGLDDPHVWQVLPMMAAGGAM